MLSFDFNFKLKSNLLDDKTRIHTILINDTDEIRQGQKTNRGCEIGNLQ
jgi:hypothetical protein